jgi:hypothetical protein
MYFYTRFSINSLTNPECSLSSGLCVVVVVVVVAVTGVVDAEDGGEGVEVAQADAADAGLAAEQSHGARTQHALAQQHQIYSKMVANWGFVQLVPAGFRPQVSVHTIK